MEKWKSTFQQLSDDGEVHIDRLFLALELVGFPKPNQTWVTNVLSTLTSYSTLDLAEFLDFLTQYEDIERCEAQQLFESFDYDNSGTMDLVEIRELFEVCGITPMSHVIKDIVMGVAPKDLDKLTFDDFWQVLLSVRRHEGFTSSEVEEIKSMFHKFDIDKSGSLESQELSRVLRYLGFAMDEKVVNHILREVDVDGDGSLDEREFLVCMRKVRENEVALMRRVFDECDVNRSGGICSQELVIVLRTMGYYPENEEIWNAMEDAGVKRSDEMDFAQLWLFIEAYRKREGFSKVDVEELRQAFDNADIMADGTKRGYLDALTIGHIFIRSGLPVNCTQAQRFVANVDIDGSGTIDFGEFLKIARHLCEDITAKANMAYSDVEGCASALHDLLELLVPVSYSCDRRTVACKTKPEQLDRFGFVSSVNVLRSLTRDHVKANHGFGEAEVEELQEHFNEYDRDRNGLLSWKDVQNLLETAFPQLTHSADSRSELMEIMKDTFRDGEIEFADFVRFMRRVSDLTEMARIMREKSVTAIVSFSAPEINEFRELFLGDSDREFLSLSEVQEMLATIVPMGAKNTKALTKVFDEVVTDRISMKAEFSEFLLLLHRLLDSDVAGINHYAEAKAGATAWESEPSPALEERCPSKGAMFISEILQASKKRRTTKPTAAPRRLPSK
jgi:calcium-binding protein CML